MSLEAYCVNGADPCDAAREAIFFGAISTSIKTEYDARRAAAMDALAAGQIAKQLVTDVDGVPLGTVSWSPPELAAPKVLDPAALLEWVKKNRPTEVIVVEQVNPAYVDKLLKQAQRNPERVPITSDGVIVPGVGVPDGGRLTVNPSPEAKRRIRALLREATKALQESGGYTELPQGAESV